MPFFSLSCITNKNGRLHLNSIGRLRLLLKNKTTVAAAASVPFSLTSTTALWSTLEIYNPVESYAIPLKSALELNANGAPNAFNVSAN